MAVGGGSGGNGLVEITHESSGGPTVVYTVPTGKRLVITDITISNGSNDNFYGIQRNNVTISKPYILVGSTYQRSYVNGIEFNEGDTVGVSAPSTNVFFELRGVLTDNN